MLFIIILLLSYNGIEQILWLSEMVRITFTLTTKKHNLNTLDQISNIHKHLIPILDVIADL